MEKEHPKSLGGIIYKTKSLKGDCMWYVMTMYEDKGILLEKYIYSNLEGFEKAGFKEMWSRYGKTLYHEAMVFKGKDFAILYNEFSKMYKKNEEKFKTYEKTLKK